MLWHQFYFQNAYFAIHLFVALVLFAVFWLYFDAWFQRRWGRDMPKLLGFLLLSLSYVWTASMVYQGLGTWQWNIAVSLRLLGYFLLVLGLSLDPIQDRPKHQKSAIRNQIPKAGEEQGLIQGGGSVGAGVFGLGAVPFEIMLGLIPLGAFFVGILYLYRGTVGLERHVRPMAVAFLLMGFASVFALAELFQNTHNAGLYVLVARYSWLWWLEQLLLLGAGLVMGKWVWQYMLKRLQSQLFMVFVLVVMGVFLITTTVFTSVLMHSVQDEIERRLMADVKVLSYAVEQQQAAIMADSQFLAASQELLAGLKAEDETLLQALLLKAVKAKQYPFAVVLNADGKVVARGDSRDMVGGSLSDAALVRSVLEGEASSSVQAKTGVLNEQIWLEGAAPIMEGERVVGGVLLAHLADNVFVDGVKRSTGLDAAVYSGDVLAASTFVSGTARQRWVGTKLANENIIEPVLMDGETVVGEVQLVNVPYLGAYHPLVDANDVPVGMLFVGSSQLKVAETAMKSIHLTFRLAAVLMLVSIVPAFLVARYITYQVR